MNANRNHGTPLGRPASRALRAGIAAAAIAALGVLVLALWPESVAPEPGLAPPGATPLPRTTIAPRAPSQPPPMRDVRPEVRAALGHAENLPTARRIHEIMAMRGPLSEDEISELLRALLAPPEPDAPAADHATLFHEIANLLHRQELDRRQFAEVLATVAGDATRGQTVCDYALQHLRIIWRAAADQPELRHAIEATFAGFAVHGHPLRASALLSLHLIDPRGARPAGQGPLENEVIGILNDHRASGDTAVHLRMVAARIAGERRLAGSRGALLRLASSDATHALVRMASISALGRLGVPADLHAISSLAPHDPRVAEAIRLTLAANPE